MSRVRCALLGLGSMGRRHLAAVDKVPALELVAACDRRPDVLERAEGRSGVALFAEPEELFATTQLDLAIVATHAPSHCTLVKRALAAGVRLVLCEKPLAQSVGEAEDLLAATNAAQARVAVNHSRRHAAGYRWLRSRLRSGDWGVPRAVTFSSPGIGLGCIGTHFVDLMRFLIGDEFAWVGGSLDPERTANPRGSEFHDPGGTLLAAGRGGVRYVHHQTEDGVGAPWGRIETTHARIEIDEGACEIGCRQPHDGSGPLETVETHELRLDLVELSARALEELVSQEPLSCDLTDGMRSLEAIVALHIASRGGSAVALPLAAHDQTVRLSIT